MSGFQGVRPVYIALCGAPKAGKTTAAGIMCRRYGAELVDDGRVLREAAMTLHGLTGNDVYTQEGKARTKIVGGKPFTHRQLLGDLGNLLEGFYGEQFIPERALHPFVSTTRPAAEGPPFHVFASVRKTQGLSYKAAGGFVIEVLREGCEAVNDFDRYDRDLVDHTLINHGSELDLEIQILRLFEWLGFEPSSVRA